jgi:hypothetical protein
MNGNLDDVIHKAVSASLAVIDEATKNATRKSSGPCGDELAGKLHETIEKALKEHLQVGSIPHLIAENKRLQEEVRRESQGGQS